MSGAIPSLSNTPSWRGAQLKHRDNFTFYLYIYIKIPPMIFLLRTWHNYFNVCQQAWAASYFVLKQCQTSQEIAWSCKRDPYLVFHSTIQKEGGWVTACRAKRDSVPSLRHCLISHLKLPALRPSLHASIVRSCYLATTCTGPPFCASSLKYLTPLYVKSLACLQNLIFESVVWHT
jgi:hypothetical protein